MSVQADISSLFGRYRAKGILIDTNLLIGYLIALFDPRQLRNCRATKNFSVEEFALLAELMPQDAKLITTPHVLTAVSNPAGKLPEGVLAGFRLFLKFFISQVQESEVTAKRAAANPAFLRFGLTDAAIAEIVPGEFLVITDDLPLYMLLNRRGADVINFNHLRVAS